MSLGLVWMTGATSKIVWFETYEPNLHSHSPSCRILPTIFKFSADCVTQLLHLQDLRMLMPSLKSSLLPSASFDLASSHLGNENRASWTSPVFFWRPRNASILSKLFGVPAKAARHHLSAGFQDEYPQDALRFEAFNAINGTIWKERGEVREVLATRYSMML